MDIQLLKTGPINAQVALPGSKSYTNRALIIAALCDGMTILENASQCEDTNVLIESLRQLGLNIKTKDAEIEVQGWGDKLPSVRKTINVGAAGSSTRFLTALVAILPNSEVTIAGNERMNMRPIGPLVDALRSLGANISYLGSEGSTPIKIKTDETLRGNSVSIDGSVSSQYISALMLVAPALRQAFTINITGELTSASYINITKQMIEEFGVKVRRNDNKTIELSGHYVRRERYSIEADASGAVNLLGLVAVSGGQIMITNLSSHTLQGDIQFLDILEQMGCKKIVSKTGIGVSSDGILHGINYDMNELPDSAMAASTVAAFADTKSTLTGLKTLKHKETDRLNALSEQLDVLGVSTEIENDRITIYPVEKQLNLMPRIKTYDDHRIAMAFSIATAKSDVIIEDKDVVVKSFPSFWEILNQIGIKIKKSP